MKNDLPEERIVAKRLPLSKLVYGVHLLTTSGIVPAALAMREIWQSDCDPRIVFLYLLLTTLIDAVDGPLARYFDVKTHAPGFDGRTIDDLLDYLTFAFIPLALIWRMDWMPDGWAFTVVFAMGASLLGFSHRQAKDESRGVFRGFPSYWNFFAIYAGTMSIQWSPWVTAISLWMLTVLTISPVWLLYPNLAPPHYKKPIFVGGIIWAASLIGILVWEYPNTPIALVVVSLAYPLFYSIVSYRHVRSL